MIVCSCKAIRDRDITALVKAHGGAVRMRDLRECLGVCDNCGKCARTAYEVLRESRAACVRTDFLHSIEALRSGGVHDDRAPRPARSATVSTRTLDGFHPALATA